MELERPKSKQSIPSDATEVFKGKIFSVYQWPQRLFDGKKVTFEAVKRPDSVNVLPITSGGKIVLAKQEQPGMKPFIGALGGRVDEGETPLQAAERELHEESGLQAKSFELWHATFIAEKFDWVVWTFIAKDCTQAGSQHVDAGEKINLIEVTFDEYLNIIAQEEYRDTDIAFKLLKLAARGELDDVKKLWFE